MKKQLSAVLAVLLFAVLVVPSAFSVGRWEKGLKLTGWYTNSTETDTMLWRSGVDAQLKRTDAFSRWVNGFLFKYGENIKTSDGEVKSMDPNGISVYTQYVRDINAFTSWGIYLGIGAAYKPYKDNNPFYVNTLPETDPLPGNQLDGSNPLKRWSYRTKSDLQLDYNKKINRYLTLTGRLRSETQIDPDIGSDNSLGLRSLYERPIGYRTKILWDLAYYQNLRGNQYKIDTTLGYSYKLGKKLSLVFNTLLSTNNKKDAAGQSQEGKIWRSESLDLTYDLLYSGGTTY